MAGLVLPFTGTLPNRAPDSMNYQNIQYSPTSMAMPYAELECRNPVHVARRHSLRGELCGREGNSFNLLSVLRQLMDDAPTKYMGLSQYGDYLGDDIDADLADPAAAAVLARFGITSQTFPQLHWRRGLLAAALPAVQQHHKHVREFWQLHLSRSSGTARRRVSSGLNFIAAYTWSKTLRHGLGPRTLQRLLLAGPLYQ